MANSITTLVPKIIAGRSLEFLRENAVTPRLVQNLSDKVVAQKGDVVTLPDTDAITVTNVTAAATPPAYIDTTLASKYVTINRHRKVSFGLTDKELHEIQAGNHFIPGQMEEAMRSLANDVDGYLLGLYTGCHNFAGTAGTTPFATTLEAYRDARKLLNKDLAPIKGRNVILDEDAEANAIVLEQFLAADRVGGREGILDGEIGRKLGCNWFMNQSIPTHTVGTWGCAATCGTEISATATAGTSTLIVQGTSATTTIGGTILAGDVFYVVGDTQPYVVKVGGTVAAAAAATLALTVSPPLRVTLAAAALVTWYASTTATNSDLLDVSDPAVNLMFHPNAIAFVSRPMASTSSFLGNSGNFTSIVRDPLSGISMRMEIIREYKQWLVDYDILYGATMVRPELACRIHG